MTEEIKKHEQRELAAVDGRSFQAILFDDNKFAKMSQFAEIMACGASTVPKHLQGKKADCFAICIQSTQWGMNPFVVAQKTHLVNGTLGYEAQLINAVIVNSGAIIGRPKYDWVGDWSKVEGLPAAGHADESGLGVTVTCKMSDGVDESWTCWLASCTTRNSPNWKTKKKLQLSYQALKEWARLYAPDTILGVYSNDELSLEPIAEVYNDSAKKVQPESVTVEQETADEETIDRLKSLIDQLQVTEEKKAWIDRMGNAVITQEAAETAISRLTGKIRSYAGAYENVRKYMHAVGVELYGADRWDDERAALVKSINEQKTSSTELDLDELRRAVDILNDEKYDRDNQGADDVQF
jgi:hypothetical protein